MTHRNANMQLALVAATLGGILQFSKKWLNEMEILV